MHLFIFICGHINNLLFLFLELLLLYNIYQFSRQSQIIYLISYKFIILFYLAFIFIYLDIDFAALLLWMVYGGFLSIIFILSFLWMDLSIYKFQVTSRLYNYIIIFICFYYSLHFNNICLIWDLIFINYYELLSLNYEEELEVLGLGVGIENIIVITIISILLTMVCLLIVLVITTGRKLITLYNFQVYFLNYVYILNIKFITLRTQVFYLQENLYLNTTSKHFKLFHCRRL